MKFTSTKDNLMSGINIVQKAISSKGAVPILSGIYLKAEKHCLTFTATDLDISISCTQPAQVLEEGHVVVPAHLFAEMVRRLPNTNLLFTYDADTVSIHIQYDQAETSIKCWLGEEFPGSVQLEEKERFTIQPLVLKDIVKQAGFCANVNDSRPIFTGVLLEVAGNDLTMVSTDSHRLAMKSCKINNLTESDFSMIVPVRSLNEISRILRENTEDVVSVVCDGHRASFSCDDIRMVTRLIDGSFPNYRQVIPDTFVLSMQAKRRQLLDSIDRASLFVPERDGSNILRFNIGDGNINIVSKSEYGMVNENLPVHTEGEDLSILFNAKYLTDALKTIEQDDLDIRFAGPLSPAVFRPLNEENSLYLLLPLRG